MPLEARADNNFVCFLVQMRKKMLLKFTDLYSYSILSNCFVGCTDCVGRSFTLILVKTKECSEMNVTLL